MKLILVFVFQLIFLGQALAQNTVDTIPFYDGVKIRTLDENGNSILDCEYDTVFWNLRREIVYDKHGREQRSIRYQIQSQYKSVLNDFTGFTEISELDAAGNLVRWYEETPDTFETRYEYYFPNGRIAVKGLQARVPVFSVDSMDSVRVYGEKKNLRRRSLSPVGEWHYYYENGNDSAVVNYASEVYEYSDQVPSCDSVWLLMVIVNTYGVQTGTWYYYSADGKLLYTEEWYNGNLLNRKENP